VVRFMACRCAIRMAHQDDGAFDADDGDDDLLPGYGDQCGISSPD